jgi:hypothetical protein
MFNLNFYIMSNINDYNAKLDVLKAIPIEEISTPTLPIDVFLQEAENLFHWCGADSEAFAKVGLWIFRTKLTPRIRS